MNSHDVLNAAMSALHAKGITAEYYFSYGEAIVSIDGQQERYPMLKEGDHEAACADLLLKILGNLLPINKTIHVSEVGEQPYRVYRVTRRNRVNGFSEVLHLDESTLDTRQLKRLESDTSAFLNNPTTIEGAPLAALTPAQQEAAANETIHLLPRIG